MIYMTLLSFISNSPDVYTAADESTGAAIHAKRHFSVISVSA